MRNIFISMSILLTISSCKVIQEVPEQQSEVNDKKLVVMDKPERSDRNCTKKWSDTGRAVLSKDLTKSISSSNGGQVAVIVQVNGEGNVLGAEIYDEKTEGVDSRLKSQALDYARTFLFEVKGEPDKIECGYIVLGLTTH